MKRIGRIGRLRPGAVVEYVRLHQDFPSELHAALNEAGIHNFSIFLHGLDLFAYLELDGDDWDTALAYLDQDPPTQEWSKLMRTLLDKPLPWPVLPEVFHVD